MNEKLQIEQIGAHFFMKNVSYEPFRRCSLHPILCLSSESLSLLDLPLQDQSVVPPSFWRKADFCWCREVSGSVSPFPIDFTLLHFLCFGTGSDRVAAVCLCVIVHTLMWRPQQRSEGSRTEVKGQKCLDYDCTEEWNKILRLMLDVKQKKTYERLY